MIQKKAKRLYDFQNLSITNQYTKLSKINDDIQSNILT